MASKIYPSVRPKEHNVNGDTKIAKVDRTRLAEIKALTNSGQHIKAQKLYEKFIKLP